MDGHPIKLPGDDHGPNNGLNDSPGDMSPMGAGRRATHTQNPERKRQTLSALDFHVGLERQGGPPSRYYHVRDV